MSAQDNEGEGVCILISGKDTELCAREEGGCTSPQASGMESGKAAVQKWEFLSRNEW